MLTPTENTRVFVGLAIQPFVAALVTALLFPLLASARSARTGLAPGGYWDSTASLALAVALVSVGITVLGAVPLLAIQLSQGPVSKGQILASGFALGISILLSSSQSRSSQRSCLSHVRDRRPSTLICDSRTD